MQELLSAPLAEKIRLRTVQIVEQAGERGVEPHLAVVLVGSDPASVRFTGVKSKAAKQCGIIFSLYQIDEDASYQMIADTLQFLATDESVHGIVLQLPLPEVSKSRTDDLIKLIPVAKDVDGLRDTWVKEKYSDTSLEALFDYRLAVLPPMVSSIVSLLDEYAISLDQPWVLIGNGRLVGQPMHRYLDLLGIANTVVTEETDKILDITQKASIVVAATGQPDLVTYQWIKEGAVVLDCANDVHRDSVEQVAQALAPAKGGVGPLTVAWLLYAVAQTALHTEEVL